MEKKVVMGVVPPSKIKFITKFSERVKFHKKWGALNIDIGVPDAPHRPPCFLLRFGTKSGYIVLCVESPSHLEDILLALDRLINMNKQSLWCSFDQAKQQHEDYKQFMKSRRSNLKLPS